METNKTNKESDFSGKVFMYSNINWKEKRIEKDFSDKTEFDSFVKENNFEFPSIDLDLIHNFKSTFFPVKDFLESIDLKSLFNETPLRLLDTNKWITESVDLNSYRDEIKRIEQEKKDKKLKIERLESAEAQLRDYISTFEIEWKEELKKKAQEDLKKIESELKILSSEDNKSKDKDSKSSK